MAPCPHRYPLVVTTNGGYPLDQNLYQAVKGMSAAAQVVSEGGCILTAAECADGFPEHGNFRTLLFDYASPRELLDAVQAPGFSVFDQWEAQTLAMIQVRARVALYSAIPPDRLRRAHIEPVADMERFLADEISRIGAGSAVAVLPEGPMTIPYVSKET
jgi:nickel-dependent lactate racemase